jgi:glutamine synthetase
MAMHQILPAAMKYTHSLCDGVAAKKTLGVSAHAETQLIRNLSSSTDALYEHVEKLHNCLAAVPQTAPEAASIYYRNVIVPAMDAVREEADLLGTLTDKGYWPYPTYSDLLFY